jgi:hypothetical protein
MQSEQVVTSAERVEQRATEDATASDAELMAKYGIAGRPNPSAGGDQFAPQSSAPGAMEWEGHE